MSLVTLPSFKQSPLPYATTPHQHHTVWGANRYRDNASEFVLSFSKRYVCKMLRTGRVKVSNFGTQYKKQLVKVAPPVIYSS